MTVDPDGLLALLGRTVEYYGQQWTVEQVRTTWRRIMPPIHEVLLYPDWQKYGAQWVHVADITLMPQEDNHDLRS